MALNWKARGNGRYDALASRAVGGKYFIHWREKYYSEQVDRHVEAHWYEITYRSKDGGANNVDQISIRTLKKAKALAEFDHQKRKELINKYGDVRNVPYEAWSQFSVESLAWQKSDDPLEPPDVEPDEPFEF